MPELTLNSCPFCGRYALIETFVDEDDGEISYRVSCGHPLNCGATQNWFSNAKEAISAWNRRTTQREVE